MGNPILLHACKYIEFEEDHDVCTHLASPSCAGCCSHAITYISVDSEGTDASRKTTARLLSSVSSVCTSCSCKNLKIDPLVLALENTFVQPQTRGNRTEIMS